MHCIVKDSKPFLPGVGEMTHRCTESSSRQDFTHTELLLKELFWCWQLHRARWILCLPQRRLPLSCLYAIIHRVEQPFYKLPQLLRTSTDTWNFIHMYSKYHMFLTALLNAYRAPFPGWSAFLNSPHVVLPFPKKKKGRSAHSWKCFFLKHCTSSFSKQ